jgi:TRAP-type mannitol/chloroaromatic compound transport system permease large subunit
MGLLALPQMLKAGYDVKVSAGVITAGGCLGILIPPSVMLIVYGATAGVSVVQLYAGAFFPGIMLAGLYIGYVIVLAMIRPDLAPPLAAELRLVTLPPLTQRVADAISNRALPALFNALKGRNNLHVPTKYLLRELVVTLSPALLFMLVAFGSYRLATSPEAEQAASQSVAGSIAEPPGTVKEPAGASTGLAEPPGSRLTEPPGSAADSGLKEPPGAAPATDALKEPTAASSTAAPAGEPARTSASVGFWIGLVVGVIAMVAYYAVLSFQRLEVFKMLLSSFFPLVAAAYRQLTFDVVKESVFLTAKTSAMVCWLFVGSAIFSAAFALLGGQELVEKWVLSLNMTPTQFMLLSQTIIFILGWPLEWTEIIVIFMPIFIPLLDKFGVDPLFFGLLVALNLQTAFLSPPVAMAAFYLKGVSPPHVTLNQIFAGMMPFMGIQVIAIFLLYWWPQIGLWLPHLLYK